MNLPKRLQLPIRKCLSLFLIISMLLSSSPAAVVAADMEPKSKASAQTGEEKSIAPVQEEETEAEVSAETETAEEKAPAQESKEPEETEPAPQKDNSTPIKMERPEKKVVKEKAQWVIQDNKYVTVTEVEVGEVYELYGLDKIDGLSQLKIEFSEINGEAGKLYVKEVEVPQTIDGEEVVGRAYDITSDMENGTFKYNLYMPKSSAENAEIKYSEDGENYNDVDGEKVEGEYVKVEGLDHFTTFVVVDPLPVPEGDACLGGDECYDTIQEAVDAATSGDTIYVTPNTYNEEICIDKSLTIIGLNAAGNPAYTAGTTGANGGPVIDGAGASNCVGGQKGFWLDANSISVSIRGFTFRNHWDTDPWSGALIGWPTVSYGDVDFSYNTVESSTIRPIFIGLADNVNVEYNEVNSSYSSTFYGWGNNTLNISNNEIYADTSTNGSIKVIRSGNNGTNTISNNYLEVVDATDSVTGIEVFGSSTNTADISGNTLIGNNNPGNGIKLNYSDPAYYLPDGSIINITGTNSISGFSNGLFMNDLLPNVDININGNVIAGNMNSGITNDDKGTLVDAQNNDWGDNSGPADPTSGDGSIPETNSGTGDVVNGAVDYSNWVGNDITKPVVHDYSLYVMRNGSWVESRYVTACDQVKAVVDTTDADSGIDTVEFRPKDYDGGGYIDSRVFVSTPDADGNYSYEFTIPCDGEYRNTHQPITEDIDGQTAWFRVQDNAGNYSDPHNGIHMRFTYDETYPEIVETRMYVNGEESYLTKPGDTVRIEADVVDNASGVSRVQVWVREFPWSPNHNELTWGEMTHVNGDTYSFEFIVPDTYKDGDPLNEAFEGNYFNFRPYDNVGNSHIGWRDNFTIDATIPNQPENLTWLDEGADIGCSSYTNNYDITADWDEPTTNPDDVEYYEYRSFNPTTGWIWNDPNPIYETFRDGRFTAGEGTYGFAVRSVDAAGNKSDWTVHVIEDSCQITYDNTAPEASTWVSPSAPAFFTRLGDFGSTRAYMTFAENPDPSDVAYYEYQYNRALLDNTDHRSQLVTMTGVTCNSGTCVWTPQINDGIRNIHRFRAVDHAGNAGPWSNWNDLNESQFASIQPEDYEYEDYINFTGAFDPADGYVHGNGGYAIREQVKPESAITSPTDPTLTNDPNVTIDYTYSDTDTEVKQVEVWYDYNNSGVYSELATDTTPDGTIDVTLSNGDGVYCLHTVAEDIADDLLLDNGMGNREDAAGCELEITLDTTPPQAPVFWVEENDDEIVIDWQSVSDADTYRIYRDGTEIYEGTAMTYTDNVTGEYEYEVTSVDAATNETDLADVEAEVGRTFDVVIDDNAMENDYENNGSNSMTGSWILYDINTHPTVLDDAVGGDLYGTSGANGQTFTWTSTGFDGVYEVYASYICNTPRPVAQYEIYSGGDLVATGSIDQSTLSDGSTCGSQFSTNNEAWAMIATDVPLYAGETVEVVLISPNGVSGNVVADAVGFNYLYDFGSITGRKYQDQNMNGMFDTEEKNAAGDINRLNDWTINVYDADWNLVDSMKTGDSSSHMDDRYQDGSLGKGQYRFGNLVPGTYYVCEVMEDGWVQTSPDGAITDDHLINDPGIGWVNDPNNSEIDCYSVELAQGEDQTGVRFGNFETTGVWGIKWEDADLEGDTDGDEYLLENWTIYADTTINGEMDADAIIATTDELGIFELPGLTLGTYEVCEVMQDGWDQSFPATNFDSPECYIVEVTESGQDWMFRLFGNYEDLQPMLELDPASDTYVEDGDDLRFIVIPSGGNMPEGGYTGDDITWGGDCSGTGFEQTIPDANGDYTCTATIEDVDGDTYTLTIEGSTYTPPAPPAPQGGFVQIVEEAEEVEEEEEEDADTEEEDDGEVLGERTCDETSKVSGYVYIDSNGNGEKDDDEEGIEGVTVWVYYYNEDDERVDVAEVETDEDGYWEAEVCPGSYKVEVNEDDVPEDAVLGQTDRDIEVEEDEDLEDVSFGAEETRNGMSWIWWLLIILLILLIVGLLLYLVSKRDEEEK